MSAVISPDDVEPIAPPSSSIDPSDVEPIPAPSSISPDDVEPIAPDKAQYVLQQQASQNQPILSKVGDVAKDLVTGSWIPQLGSTLKAAATTIPQAFEPNQTGTNARQDLTNAGLLNATDMNEAARIQGPRFWDMITGQKMTPEQIGQQYDEEQAYAKIRNNIANLGANPAISQQLAQRGGLGAALSAVSAPGTATVAPERQNALESIVDPTMLIPFGGAEGGLIKGGLELLGKDAAEQIPKAGLTATLAGKAASKLGAMMGSASGLKDSLNSGLKAAAMTLTGDPSIAEFAAHHGSSALIGVASHALGAGELGAGAAFMAPQALKKGADALTTAGKVLQEGEGTVPFFERMAQEAAAQGNPLAANTYRLMDSSGAGKLLTSAAKTIKNSVKATAVTAPLQLPFAGNDPQQMANVIGGNLGFAGAGSLVHEFHPMTAADFQTRQDMDVVAMRNKYGAGWDDLAQKQNEVAIQRLLQNNPNMDPGAAKAQAAQKVRSDLGALATFVRSDPTVSLAFDPTLKTGANQKVSPDGKGSVITINPSTPSLIPQVMAHEFVHHIQASGMRGEVLNQLLGDPETKTAGDLRSYAPDGTPIDTPEFQTFRTNYAKAMAAAGLDPSFGGKQSEADNHAAEEFYAEAVGSVLGGHTNAGELNYARIRRAGGNDSIMDKFFGKNRGSALQPLEMGFMRKPDGTPSGFNALQWLNKSPALKKLTFDYIKNKAYLGQMTDKEHKFQNEFDTEEKSVDWMKANPNEAFQKYGSDASLRFSPPDAKGNREFLGVLSPKQEKALVEKQAQELFEQIKKDPKYFREVTTADGKKGYQIIHLDDKILGTLTQLNPYQKDNLIKLNQVANEAPGTVMRTTYQPALTGSKRYKARERTVRATVPYDIFISQPEGGKGGANILTHVLDIDQMVKNRTQVLALMQKAGLPVDPRYTDDNWFKESLQKMAQAHFEGKKSTDGTGISDEQRDFLNATMGVTRQEAGEPAEGVNMLLDTLKVKAGSAKMPSAVKSFRLDRINKMEPAPEYGNIPYRYIPSKVNRRPEDENARPEETPEFKHWFGDSKVVDEEGKPKMLFHGSSAEFNSFNRGDIGFHFGIADHAEKRGDALKPVYLSIKNPLEFDKDMGSWQADPVFFKKLLDMGAITKEQYAEYEPKKYGSYGDYYNGYHGRASKFARKILEENGYDGVKYPNLWESDWDDRDEEGRGSDSYIAFHPEQIKSATGNRGTFDPNDPNILHRPEDSDENNLFSHLSRAIASKMPGKATSAQLRATLKGNGVKDDEIKWSGLDDYLSKNNLVKKQDVQDFLKNEGGVKIQTHTLGEHWKPDESEYAIKRNEDGGYDVIDKSRGVPIESHDTREDAQQALSEMESGREQGSRGNDTKYSQYQLLGGTNYREQVFSLPYPKGSIPDGVKVVPTKQVNPDHESNFAAFDKSGNIIGYGDTERAALIDAGKAEGIEKGSYTSSHFSGIPNYLAHMRLNDREDSEGQPGTFIEEMQSDRHQQGREKGYKPEKEITSLPEGVKITPRKFHTYVEGTEQEHQRFDVDDANGIRLGEGPTEEQAKKNALANLNRDGIPDAPMRKTWHEYLFRRALGEAAAAGKKWIGWTTGTTQVDRYPEVLRQVIDRITWKKNTNSAEGLTDFSALKDGKVVLNGTVDKGGKIIRSNLDEAKDKDLSEVIGKTMAERVQKEDGGAIAGKDFTIGGEGMKGFYDKIIPQYVEKYAKKWGVKPELTDIPVGKEDEGKVERIYDDAAEKYKYRVRVGGVIKGIFDSMQEAQDHAYGEVPQQIWKLPITDEMRKSIEASGQPLFRPEDSSPAQGTPKARQNEPEAYSGRREPASPRATQGAGVAATQEDSPKAGERPANLGQGSGEGRGAGEQDDRFTGTRPTAPKQWLDSYIQHLGELAAARKYPEGSEGLFTHAGSAGSLIPPKAIRKLKAFEGKGGVEHEVYAPPAERGQNRKIYKITKADGYLHDGGDELDYLKYLDKLDRLTGRKLNMEVLGVTPKDATWPSIVTRMNYIEGRKPTTEELEEGLTKKYGFEPSDEYTKSFFAYKHPSTGLTIRDAHTGNFILTPEGDLVPIDVHIDGDPDKPLFRPEEIDKTQGEPHTAAHEEAGGEPVGDALGRKDAPSGLQPKIGEPDEAGIFSERHAPPDEAKASEAWAPRLVKLQQDRERLKEAGYDVYNRFGDWYPEGIRKLDDKGNASHLFLKTPVEPSESLQKHFDGPVATVDALPPKKLSNGEQLRTVANRVIDEGRDYAENLVKPMQVIDKTGSGWLPHQLPLPHSKLKDFHTILIRRNDLPERADKQNREFTHNGLNFRTQKEDWTEDKDYLAHANLAVMKGPDGNDRVIVWEAQPSFRLPKTEATKKEASEPEWKPAGISRSEALERVAEEVKKFAQEKGNLPVVLGDASTVQHIYGRPGKSTKTFNVDYSSEGYATRAFKRVFGMGSKPLKKIEFKDKLWLPALKDEERHGFTGYEFA